MTPGKTLKSSSQRQVSKPLVGCFGDSLVGVWKLSGGCLTGVWWVSGGCLKGVWKVPEGVWRVSMGCLNGNLISQD